MRTSYDDSPEFRRLLARDEDADLTRVALELARDAYPALDPRVSVTRIDRLADRVRDRCPDGAGLKHLLGQINWVLFVEERFRGNTEEYYDPRNSYLNDVLERRLGIPISLSVLYLAVAERIGLQMSGVNLPGHFVLRAGDGLQALFLDPFHGGAILDREGCAARVEQVTGQRVELSDEVMAPCRKAVIVRRMLHNLKAVYLKNVEYTLALPVMRRLVALTGGDPVERRDLGVVSVHADRPGEAIDHLQAYLEARPGADDSRQLEALLKSAKRDVALRN
jgi:regulator of sirC expression with transglutaminase-like and TPR domain